MFSAAPQPEIIDTIVTYRIMIPFDRGWQAKTGFGESWTVRE